MATVVCNCCSQKLLISIMCCHNLGALPFSGSVLELWSDPTLPHPHSLKCLRETGEWKFNTSNFLFPFSTTYLNSMSLYYSTCNGELQNTTQTPQVHSCSTALLQHDPDKCCVTPVALTLLCCNQRLPKRCTTSMSWFSHVARPHSMTRRNYLTTM